MVTAVFEVRRMIALAAVAALLSLAFIPAAHVHVAAEENSHVVAGGVTTVTSAASDPKLNEQVVDGFFSKSGHTNNWAVLVCTSRFWFNYRHMANTLSLYRTVKRLGIPDSNIVLMLADEVACNPRNAFPATVFNNANRKLNLYGDNIEVDYRGYEVTVESFIRLLTGRYLPDTPRSKKLLTDDRSNIFVYMTGHGGDEFLKFQDAEELSSYDLADAFGQMWQKRRYNEILFMIDTCQANTMFSRVYSPNILAVGSSKKGESSYSHHNDLELGVPVIDRFTYYNLEYLETLTMESKLTLSELFKSYNPHLMHSHPGHREDLFSRPLDQVLVTDFFGAVQNVELTTSASDLPDDAVDFFNDSSASGGAITAGRASLWTSPARASTPLDADGDGPAATVTAAWSLPIVFALEAGALLVTLLALTFM